MKAAENIAQLYRDDRKKNIFCTSAGRVQEDSGGSGGLAGSGRVLEDPGKYKRVWKGIGRLGRVWEGLGGSERVQEGLGGS